jgi:MFS superfamily sulfate permease-like transporter
MGYYPKFSAAMAITMGLLIIFGGMARMGFIMNFFSRPILTGFLNDIALSINANQEMSAIGSAVKTNRAREARDNVSNGNS